MPKYCPNCGAEVKEGFKFCLGCGEQLKAGATQAPAPDQTYQPQQTAPPPVAPQQMYAAVPPKKSNTKLIVGIIVAIVAIIIVVLAVILLMGGGFGGNGIVGTWEYTDTSTGTPITAVYVFNSDGTFEAGMTGYTMPMGTWRTDGNQFCITITGMTESQCFSYSISGNQMTWESAIGTITLTKK